MMLKIDKKDDRVETVLKIMKFYVQPYSNSTSYAAISQTPRPDLVPILAPANDSFHRIGTQGKSKSTVDVSFTPPPFVVLTTVIIPHLPLLYWTFKTNGMLYLL